MDDSEKIEEAAGPDPNATGARGELTGPRPGDPAQDLARRVVAVGLLIAAAGCGPVRAPDLTDDAPSSVGEEAIELPATLGDTAPPPDPDLLLPPLEGYTTDNHAHPGELESSLDHGSVPYVEVRRRLVLDDQGFTRAEITVVTVQAGTNGAMRLLAHRYGDARRTPVQLGGVEMLRIEAEPHAAIAWPGPAFVITFERGSEMSDLELQDLARATVRGIVQRND